MRQGRLAKTVNVCRFRHLSGHFEVLIFKDEWEAPSVKHGGSVTLSDDSKSERSMGKLEIIVGVQRSCVCTRALEPQRRVGHGDMFSGNIFDLTTQGYNFSVFMFLVWIILCPNLNMNAILSFIVDGHMKLLDGFAVHAGG